LFVGIARWCNGCTCTPRAEKKKRKWCNLQRKVVSAPPGRATENFLKTFFSWAGKILRVALVNLALLSVLRAMIIKVVSFFEKKTQTKS